MKTLSIGLFWGKKEVLGIQPDGAHGDIAWADEAIALAARHCPVAAGLARENEIGQTCAECIRENPDRGQICDAIVSGRQVCTLPDLTVIAHAPPGWEDRVLRRAGEDRP